MAANCERTFIAIKPDGVQRGLVGEIIKRFEQKGFRLVAMKLVHVSLSPTKPFLLPARIATSIYIYIYICIYAAFPASAWESDAEFAQQLEAPDHMSGRVFYRAQRFDLSRFLRKHNLLGWLNAA